MEHPHRTRGHVHRNGHQDQGLIARKDPDPASVTWIEPKILKRQAREAAEAEAAAKAAQEGEGNE